jgi:hypothetical protein
VSWRFDYESGDLVFLAVSSSQITDGLTNFGDEVSSDLAIDLGDRENDSSEIDMGLRIIEGAG